MYKKIAQMISLIIASLATFNCFFDLMPILLQYENYVEYRTFLMWLFTFLLLLVSSILYSLMFIIDKFANRRVKNGRI